MKQLLDLAGASGAVYRFRLTDPSELPVAGGNFVFVRTALEEAAVLACGTAESLSEVADYWGRAVLVEGAEWLYVRLNVARSARCAEHADLAPALGARIIAPERA